MTEIPIVINPVTTATAGVVTPTMFNHWNNDFVPNSGTATSPIITGNTTASIIGPITHIGVTTPSSAGYVENGLSVTSTYSSLRSLSNLQLIGNITTLLSGTGSLSLTSASNDITLTSGNNRNIALNTTGTGTALYNGNRILTTGDISAYREDSEGNVTILGTSRNITLSGTTGSTTITNASGLITLTSPQINIGLNANSVVSLGSQSTAAAAMPARLGLTGANSTASLTARDISIGYNTGVADTNVSVITSGAGKFTYNGSEVATVTLLSGNTNPVVAKLRNDGDGTTFLNCKGEYSSPSSSAPVLLDSSVNIDTLNTVGTYTFSSSTGVSGTLPNDLYTYIILEVVADLLQGTTLYPQNLIIQTLYTLNYNSGSIDVYRRRLSLWGSPSPWIKDATLNDITSSGDINVTATYAADSITLTFN